MVDTHSPIRASTQEHLDIEDIQDDIVILKTGACALIINVTAINFDLLSEGEQDAIIYAYAGLLNSLTFSIEIIIRSNIKDITDYIKLLKEQEQKQKKPLLLEQLQKYRQFIETTVRDNQVLDKKFYVVIPFTTLELGLVSTVSTSFQKKAKLPYSKPYILERAKMNLYPKRDHLFRQFARLGLQSKQLTTQQLLELFYSIYNQEGVGHQLVSSKEYQTPLVQPDLSTPANAASFPPIQPPTPNNWDSAPTTNLTQPQPTPQPISPSLESPKTESPFSSTPPVQPTTPFTPNVAAPFNTDQENTNTNLNPPDLAQQFFDYDAVK